MVRRSNSFDRWVENLADRITRSRVLTRVDRLALGNPGDTQPVGGGVSELRLHFGAGYRIYYTTKGKELLLLLIGGDKSTQAIDIEKAKAIAADFGKGETDEWTS